jgi:hypothetical protein
MLAPIHHDRAASCAVCVQAHAHDTHDLPACAFSWLNGKEHVTMKQLGIMMAFLIVLAAPLVARAERIKASLIGFQEVPVVSTVARGEFDATISEDEQSIVYELTYSGLQGTVTQAHIQTASEHCLHPWGMKPTVLDQRNPLDLHIVVLLP